MSNQNTRKEFVDFDIYNELSFNGATILIIIFAKAK